MSRPLAYARGTVPTSRDLIWRIISRIEDRRRDPQSSILDPRSSIPSAFLLSLKCSTIISACFWPTNGLNSATVASDTRFRLPKFRSNRSFNFSPTPGIEVSSEVKSRVARLDRKSTRLNSSHLGISYAVFCLKKKKIETNKREGQNLCQRDAHELFRLREDEGH